MAIKKSKTLPNGAVGEYWKIIYESYDRANKVMEVQIALFKDQTSAAAHKQHLGLVKSFKFPMSISESMGNRTVLSYAAIKELALRPGINLSNPQDAGYAYPDLVGGVDV